MLVSEYVFTSTLLQYNPSFKIYSNEQVPLESKETRLQFECKVIKSPVRGIFAPTLPNRVEDIF